jgi:hypothetical protein
MKQVSWRKAVKNMVMFTEKGNPIYNYSFQTDSENGKLMTHN